MQWKQHESEQDQIFLDLFNVTVLCLTEEVVALHDPVGGVVVAGADDAGPGHVGARGGGGRGAVLLPGREGTHIVVVLVVAPGGVGDDGHEQLLEHFALLTG